MPTGRPDPLSIAAGTGRYSGIAGPTSVQASLGLLWVVDGSSGFSTVQRDLALSYSVSGSAPVVPAGQATGTAVVDMVSVVPVHESVGAALWSGSKPWTCGLLFRRGACPAGYTPGAHGGSVQVDRLNTWDDGSLKFARASGVTTAAEIPILTRGTPATGANVAEPSVAAVVSFSSVVDASAAVVAGGSFTADIATARTAGAGTWGRTQARLVRSLLGPKCSEFHYYVPTADAHLAVWFFVRAYSDGSTEVETVIENGWATVAGPGSRTYNAAVTIGGTDRYTGTGIVQLHHTRWSRVDWVGTDPVSAMVQAPASLRATGLVPALGVDSLDAAAYTSYPQTGTKHSASTRALADRPAPFSIANIDPALGSGGDTDMYGPVPEWMGTWLIEGHAGAYWTCIANARAVGRYGLHHRDEDDGRPVRGTYRTTLVINDINSGMSPNYSGATKTPTPSGSAPPSWTYSHSPAAAFAAALLTARWAFIEQVQFQSSTADMCFNSNFKNGARIVEWYDQNRVIGWMMRDRAHAEAVTPSIINGATLTTGADFNQREETVLRIEAQMAEWQDLYVSGSGTGIQHGARGNALGAPYQQADFDLYDTTNDGVHGYGGLQNGIYLTGAFYLFNCRPSIGSTAQSRMNAVMEHLAKYPVGLLGATPGATRDWRVFAHVTIPLGTPGIVAGNMQPTIYYGSWETQYAQQQVVRTWEAGTWPLTAGSDTNLRKIEANVAGTALRLRALTSFGGDTDLIALCWATNQMHEAAGRLTVAGADLAIQRLLTSGTWANGVSNLFRQRPILSAKTSRDLPSWVPATVGEAALVPMTNTLDAVWSETPAMLNAGAGANEIADFSGGPYNRYSGRWGAHVLHGCGHSASHNNGVYAADYNDLTFKVLQAPTVIATGITGPNQYDANIINGVSPETFPDDPSNPREVATGVPGSAHTYDTMVILPPPLAGDARGALLRGVSGAVGYSSSRDTGWSHAYRFNAAQWSRWSTNYKAGSMAAGGSFVMDHTRARGWPIIPGNSLNGSLNLATRTWANTGDSLSVNSYPDLFQSAYVDDRDIVVVARQGTGSDVAGPVALFYQAAGATVPTRIAPTLSATLANDGSYSQASLVYVPELRRLIWYCFDGAPDQYQEIEIPATLTDTWTVTARSITGAGRPSLLAEGPSPWLYKRFDYAPQLKSLMWVLGRNSSAFGFGGRVLCIRVAP